MNARSLIAHPALLLTLAAIALRLIVFTARGDYIAFDEGWYLLLGRGLFDGDGYSLSGLRHTTLSPLFPILAGAVGHLTGSIVWGGRIVAALAAGLLVLPVWFMSLRLAGARTAFIACVLITVMPSLMPFAAPYWIGWDLWVGAEPFLHLFLFSALALTLRARERMRAGDWALAGASFALAYLARPEAILTFFLVGVALGVHAIVRRSMRRTLLAAVMAAAFALTALPYWIYLHDTLGRWALSGRVVDLPVSRTAADTASNGATASTPPQAAGAAKGIERMLWGNDNKPYVRILYGLDSSGERLASTYWGVPSAQGPVRSLPLLTERSPDAADDDAPGDRTAESEQASGAPTPGRWALHARALGTIVPWFLLPFIVLGIPGRRRALADEILVVLPVLATSLAVARIVGADPRTQLLVVPLAAFYVARGLNALGELVDRQRSELRPGFASGLATLVVAIFLLATPAHWVYMGWTMGSPHHTVGAGNRAMGRALRDAVPADQTVMSWHPAVALFADRDWRVLPYAPFSGIVRYANAVDNRYVVLSAFYPGSQFIRSLPTDHLLLEVPPGPRDATDVRIEMLGENELHMNGRILYLTAADTAEAG